MKPTRTVTYLGMVLDDIRYSFRQHIERATTKVGEKVRTIQRILVNIGGLNNKKIEVE